MNIVFVHNRYQQTGGEDTVVLAEKSIIEQNNHEIFLFQVSNDSIMNFTKKIVTAACCIYSLSFKKLLIEKIKIFMPDIVHVHNFFPLLSPSVYRACIECNVPVIQTLHNFRLICSNALFFRNGQVCEDCLEKLIPWPGILHGCYRNSRIGTVSVAAMISINRLLGTWKNSVSAYIALTEFGRQKMIQSGLPSAKIVVKPNFITDPGCKQSGPGDYALFVGRISVEKGLDTIIQSYQHHIIDAPIVVVGDGPLLPELQDRVKISRLGDKINFLGRREKSDVLKLMREARFLVFPSVWYEGFPMTILEAFASGIPVIASNLGGVPEIVEDRKTGWLVPPGNAEAWADAINTAWSDPDEAQRRGFAARKEYETKYTPEINYRQLMAIYESVIKK